MSWLNDALSKAEEFLEKADEQIAKKYGTGEEEEEDSKDLRDYVSRKARLEGQYVEREPPKPDVTDEDLLADLTLDETSPNPSSNLGSAAASKGTDDWSDEEDNEEENKAAEAPNASSLSPKASKSPLTASKQTDSPKRTNLSRCASAPEGRVIGLADALQENARLKKEVEKLNNELDDMDDRMIRAQDQLDKEKELVARTKRLARQQILQMRDDLSQQQASGGDQEKEFVAALESKEKYKEELSKQLEEANADRDSIKARMASLRKELDNALHMKAEAEVKLEEASGSTSEEAVQLRVELQRMEEALQSERSAHTTSQKDAQKRSAELEESNADLAKALAASERALAAKGQAEVSSMQESATAESDYRAAQLELQSMHTSLQFEREQKQALQQEMQTLMGEMAALRAAEEQARGAARSQLRDLQAQLQAAEAELGALRKAQGGAGSRTDASLEARVKELSNLLLAKTDELNVSKTELTAMRGRMQRLQVRLEQAEKYAKVDDLDLGQGVGMGVGMAGADLEMGSGVGSTLSARRRGGGSKKTGSIMSELKPVVRHKQVQDAVDALVDKFALDTGRFLRYNPMARLIFLLYLIVLHLWAGFILSFHSHQIERMHADTGSNLPAPPGV